jgi:hypothetical protein
MWRYILCDKEYPRRELNIQNLICVQLRGEQQTAATNHLITVTRAVSFFSARFSSCNFIVALLRMKVQQESLNLPF